MRLETLRKVEGAEKLLRERGFIQVRVRHHGSVARIEIESKRFPDLLKKETRESLSREIKKLGYSYVALDIDGYRTGSLNEPFKKPRR